MDKLPIELMEKLLCSQCLDFRDIIRTFFFIK